MAARSKPKRRFAICIRTDDPDLLTPRRIYEVLPDENAAKSQYIRVIDNEVVLTFDWDVDTMRPLSSDYQRDYL
jgi:hypothetical protein